MEFQHEQIVKDPKQNQALFERGYCILPFLTPAEVKELTSLFHANHSQENIQGLYVSSHAKSWEELNRISEQIGSTVSPHIDKHFQNIKKIGGTFIVKPTDENNRLEPHQDWRIVDEDQYRSFTIWIALQDTNDYNGCMYVLPTSQNWIRGFRHITIPSVYGKVYELSWKYMTPVHLKAGEAIVFDQALVHASKANQSSSLRIAATNTIISKNASMRICCNHNGVVEEYECPPGFYIKPESTKAPLPLNKLRDTDFKMTQMDEATFIAFAKKNGLIKPGSIHSKISKFISKWM
jgi:hypothetical protein